MSDIFREVEEDVRKERAQQLWKRYGTYLIVLGVVALAGVGGWQLWKRHQLQEREKASTAFVAAQRISNPQAAATAFNEAASGAPKGYAEVARLAQANAMFAAGQTKEAIAVYRDIANADKGPVGAAARLRAAWALSETGTRQELATLLEPINQAGSPWRENAQEVLAYADYRAMDRKAAQAKFEALANAAEAPQALKARARAMVDFLKGGGASAYGTVPPDVVALPPPPAGVAPTAASVPPQAP